MSPVDRDCPVTGTNFKLGVHVRNFSPVPEMKKGRNEFRREIRETRQPGRNTKL